MCATGSTKLVADGTICLYGEAFGRVFAGPRLDVPPSVRTVLRSFRPLTRHIPGHRTIRQDPGCCVPSVDTQVSSCAYRRVEGPGSLGYHLVNGTDGLAEPHVLQHPGSRPGPETGIRAPPGDIFFDGLRQAHRVARGHQLLGKARIVAPSPPMSEATTGVSQAIDSLITRPCVSKNMLGERRYRPQPSGQERPTEARGKRPGALPPGIPTLADTKGIWWHRTEPDARFHRGGRLRRPGNEDP